MDININWNFLGISCLSTLLSPKNDHVFVIYFWMWKAKAGVGDNSEF